MPLHRQVTTAFTTPALERLQTAEAECLAAYPPAPASLPLQLPRLYVAATQAFASSLWKIKYAAEASATPKDRMSALLRWLSFAVVSQPLLVHGMAPRVSSTPTLLTLEVATLAVQAAAEYCRAHPFNLPANMRGFVALQTALTPAGPGGRAPGLPADKPQLAAAYAPHVAAFAAALEPLAAVALTHVLDAGDESMGSMRLAHLQEFQANFEGTRAAWRELFGQPDSEHYVAIVDGMALRRVDAAIKDFEELVARMRELEAVSGRLAEKDLLHESNRAGLAALEAQALADCRAADAGEYGSLTVAFLGERVAAIQRYIRVGLEGRSSGATALENMSFFMPRGSALFDGPFSSSIKRRCVTAAPCAACSSCRLKLSSRSQLAIYFLCTSALSLLVMQVPRPRRRPQLVRHGHAAGGRHRLRVRRGCSAARDGAERSRRERQVSRVVFAAAAFLRRSTCLSLHHTAHLRCY